MAAEGGFLAVQCHQVAGQHDKAFASIEHENVRETPCRYGSDV